MKILIVEDEESVAEVIQRILTPIAREIQVVGTLAEAMRLISESKFDLVTLDLTLKDADGDRTLSQIREIVRRADPGLLIVITGSVEPTLEARCLEAGAHGFIFKPAVGSSRTFFEKLADLGRSILRNPVKYQTNLTLAERLIEKVLPRLGELS